jgi:WD40 repeat protein
MSNRFSKIGPDQNLLPVIQETNSADNLLYGSEGELIQWSVSQKKVNQGYADFMDHTIESMVQTSDKKHLFL